MYPEITFGIKKNKPGGEINMKYCHQWTGGNRIELPAQKAVCVGRNYAEHAAELNNPIPTEPILFIKPETSIVSLHEPIVIPKSKGEVHYETEISVLIGKILKNADRSQVLNGIIGIGMALDLTLRALQSRLKEQGQPWEKAKAFDGSCPLSCFVPIQSFSSLTNLEFELTISDKRKQTGSSAQMLFDIVSLIEYISTWFTLKPGDVVLTGTPKGVGPLIPGDRIHIKLQKHLEIHTVIIAESL